MIDLRVGRWQEALADIGEVDAVICDPPYGARTHAANANNTRFNMNGHAPRRNLTYTHWDVEDVQAFVSHWSPLCKSWFCAMTSDDLIPAWQTAFTDCGRLSFAPVPCLYHRPRMQGDGPGSGTVYLMVARPRQKRFFSWGSLPCWYGPIMAPRATDPDHHIGGKPLSIMLEIVRDYTRPGDLVVDPTAGGATTLIAAHTLGRRAIGAEMDPVTAAKAQARIDRHLRQQTLFEPAAMATQPRLEV